MIVYINREIPNPFPHSPPKCMVTHSSSSPHTHPFHQPKKKRKKRKRFLFCVEGWVPPGFEIVSSFLSYSPLPSYHYSLPSFRLPKQLNNPDPHQKKEEKEKIKKTPLQTEGKEKKEISTWSQLSILSGKLTPVGSCAMTYKFYITFARLINTTTSSLLLLT